MEAAPGEPPIMCFDENTHCENRQPGAECVCDAGFTRVGEVCVPAAVTPPRKSTSYTQVINTRHEANAGSTFKALTFSSKSS